MRLLPLCIIFASVAITVIGHGTFLLGDQHDFPISFAHIGTYLSGLPANTTLPQRVHISLGANASSMIISYVHNDLLWAYPTGVYYGTSPCNNNPNCTYESSAPGNFHSYYYQAGMFVDAVLSDLEPDTLYYYKVGNNHSGFSNETTFQTPPLKTPPQFSFAVYGDMGVLYSNGTIELLQDLVESDDIVGVLHVGDISYADDRMPYQYEEIWDLFFDRIEPISSRVPYMVCPGNHEYPYNYTVFKQRFMMPGLLEGSNSYTGTNMYHSFDYANVHFVAVSTEPSPYFSSQGTQQYTWLEKDLSNAADRKNSGEIDWIVVFGHKPLYCTFNWSDCCGNCNQTGFSPTWDTGATSQQLRSSFEQLLIQYSVDLYVAGHVHSYERMFPLDNWVWQEMEDPNVYLSPKFPVHIVAGSAGCIETVPDPFPMNWTSPATVSRLEDYGFGKLTFYGATELLWQFIGSNTTNYGEVLDEFKIVRQ